MANKKKLMELKEIIRTHQERWNQHVWTDGLTNPDATSYEECQTSFCAAGWTAVANGWKPVALPTFWDNDYESGSRFVPRNAEARRDHPDFKLELAREAEHLGAEILELTQKETQALFMWSSDMEDFEEFATLIDAIADNHLDEWLMGTDYDGFDYSAYSRYVDGNEFA